MGWVHGGWLLWGHILRNINCKLESEQGSERAGADKQNRGKCSSSLRFEGFQSSKLKQLTAILLGSQFPGKKSFPGNKCAPPFSCFFRLSAHLLPTVIFTLILNHFFRGCQVHESSSVILKKI